MEEIQKETLTIDISPGAFRELLLLKRTDLPPKISIELACQMHPFLEEILNVLHIAAHKIYKPRETNMLLDAVIDVEKKEHV